MMFKSMAAGFVVALTIAAPAMSASLSIQSIDGDWQNATPTVTGEGTSQIRWGTETGYGQSGYNFDASGNMIVEDETSFVLGTFTHLNFPIRLPLLTSVELSFQFMVDGVADAITSVFSFDHWETYNQAATCANDASQGVGVNSNGCADRVTATSNEGMSEEFTIDGITYVLDVTGFFYEDELMDDFWTTERMTNEAQLLGSFRVVPPSEVPLPASGLLLLGGVAGLAMARRRRK